MQYLIGSNQMYNNGEVGYVDKPVGIIETETS